MPIACLRSFGKASAQAETSASADSNEYPLFARERAAVRDEAELIAVSYSDLAELTFKTDDEIERVNRQYVSGWMFPAFEIRPAAGRLFTEDDDRTRGEPA